MTDIMVLLAVYGTLKQGNHNHKVHLNQKPIFADKAPLFAEMYSNGRYPMLIKSDEEQDIFIEIYKISEETLHEIDKLEEPFDYHRETINIAQWNNVWIYYYTPGKAPQEFDRVESGNFEKTLEWE